MNPHQVLGVDPTASREDINKAYIDKVAKHHPNNGGDAWAFQQVQKAYEELTGFSDSTAQTQTAPFSVPPPIPVPMAVPLPDSAEEPAPFESPFHSHSQSTWPDVENPTIVDLGATDRKQKTRSNKKRSNMVLVNIVGIVAGAISAVVVSYFILQRMGYFEALNPTKTAENADAIDNHDSSTKKLAGLDNNFSDDNTSDSNQTKKRQAEQKADSMKSGINLDPYAKDDQQIKDLENKPTPNSKTDKKTAGSDTRNSPSDKRPVNKVPALDDDASNENKETNNRGFILWDTLIAQANAFEATLSEPIDAKRTELQQKWFKEFQDAVNGKRYTFRFTIDNFQRIQRGAYNFQFSDLENEFSMSDRLAMKMTKSLKLKIADSKANKLGKGDIVEISGVIEVGWKTSMEALLTNQNRYLPVFQFADGQTDFTIALDRYRVKYISAEGEESSDSDDTTDDDPTGDDDQTGDGN